MRRGRAEQSSAAAKTALLAPLFLIEQIKQGEIYERGNCRRSLREDRNFSPPQRFACNLQSAANSSLRRLHSRFGGLCVCKPLFAPA